MVVALVAVKTVLATISKHVQQIHALRALLTHVLQVIHVQATVLAIHALRALLTHVLQVIHVLRALLTHVRLALEIPVHPLAPVLPNQNLVVNVETSAAANHDSPSSSQFSLESSRFW